VRFLDISAVHDEESETLTFFAINRHTLDVEIRLQGFDQANILDCLSRREPGDRARLRHRV
jgi:alpha-L-arabinofuranosidase